jgi:hypothetical protein
MMNYNMLSASQHGVSITACYQQYSMLLATSTDAIVNTTSEKNANGYTNTVTNLT